MPNEPFERDNNDSKPLDETFWNDIDLDVDSMQFSSDAPDKGTKEMQETFLAMIRNNLNPIARYMKALPYGEDAKEIYEISELVITPLIAKVEQVGLISHAEDLTFFRSLLLLALGETDQHAKTKLQEVVLEGFQEVQKKFELNYRGYRKAVRNLVELYRALKSVDALTSHDVKLLFAIGIPSLSWFKKMKASELAALSGVVEEKIQKVKEISGHGFLAMRFAAAELARDSFQPINASTASQSAQADEDEPLLTERDDHELTSR